MKHSKTILHKSAQHADYAKKAFFMILLASLVLFCPAKAADKSHSSQIQTLALQIQNSFKNKIDTLEFRLKFILDAEQKDITRAKRTANEYKQLLNNFAQKHARAKELYEAHHKIMVYFLQKAKTSAMIYGVLDEFGAFEAEIGSIASGFLARLEEAKQGVNAIKIESSAKTLTQKMQNQSIYKEKMGYILAEFENEYTDIIWEAYKGFDEKIDEIWGKQGAKEGKNK